MKLFFYSHTLRPGGAEKQCALMAAELKRRYGHDTVVLLNNADEAKPEYLQYLKDAGAELIKLPKSPVGRVRRLYRVFRANRDAVLFNYLTYPDFVGALVARLAGLKRIFGGIETDRMFGYKFWLEKFSHKFLSYKTTCNSYRAFEFFASRGFDRERMPITPSAIELSECEPVLRNDEMVRIIAVGRFVPEKDYLTWVDVIADLHQKEPQVRATIIGYGVLEAEIRARIKQHGLESIIEILPGQTTDVRGKLRKHDIYFSSSIQEGTSNTILEAMEASLPIVATTVGDNARMVEPGASGFLLAPKDVKGMSAALAKLVGDVNLRCAYGHRSREIVKERYSLEEIAKEYDLLIKGACSSEGNLAVGM